jgi:hypothetical protein
MNLKNLVILSGLTLGMFTAQAAMAQEAPALTPDPVAAAVEQMASVKESEMQWAWGEVTNLDEAAKTLTLKYLDYEADQEKDLVLVIDEKTAFENVKDFSELKLKDTLSIDYIITPDNKNIAKNISFEKPDSLAPVPLPAVPEAPVSADLPAPAEEAVGLQEQAQ